MAIATKRFTPQEVETLAAELGKRGMHPRQIRRRLAEIGISWSYQFLGQGRRERFKRLKRFGQDICPSCQFGKDIGSTLCGACLVKKWSPAS